MLTQAQENYLAKKPDGEIRSTHPFDPRTREVAKALEADIRSISADLDVRFIGSAALGIAGQNDIDMEILSTPEEHHLYLPSLEKLFGAAFRENTSWRWKFNRDGFSVDLSLADKNHPDVVEQLRVFEILSQDENLRREYEALKLPYGPIDYKEYQRKKYAFYNKILNIL